MQIPVRRLMVSAAAVLALIGCMNQRYRFERIDSQTPAELPMKFVSLTGVRDGDSVRADLRLAAGDDSAQIRIALHLGPPAQFTSGAWQLGAKGETTGGALTCD